MTEQDRQRSRVTRWVRITGAVMAATLVAACDPAPGGAETPDRAGLGPLDQQPALVANRTGCADAGPRTRDFLPQFASVTTRRVINPCLGLTDLPTLIADLVPDSQKKDIGPFLNGVGKVAGKVLAIDDLAECGYQTDRLALGVYQDRATRWSIGVVAVTRGRVDALLDVSRCFLLKQIPFAPPSVVRTSEGRQPEPELCVESRHRVRGGQRYTVVWLGSSTTMCAEMEAQLSPGVEVDGGVTATVKADPNLSVRTGPSTAGTRLRREPAGQVLIVTCYRVGQAVSGRRGTSNRWYRLDSERPEYVSGAWLDTGDTAGRPPKCR